MNFCVFVQARLTSSRFKGKVLKKIKDNTLLNIILSRLKKSKKIDKIIVLIPDNKKNLSLKKILIKQKVLMFEGSEKNVLDRYFQASRKFKPKNIIRITADCPLVDFKIIDKMITIFKSKKCDYMSNTSPPTFPDGLDIEIFKTKALEKVWKTVKNKYDREHVTSFFKSSNKFNILNLRNKEDYSHFRFTVDYREDLNFMKKIFNYFSPSIYFSWKQVVKLSNVYPKWFLINRNLKK